MRQRQTRRHSATAAVIARLGGVYATANALGLSAAAVSKWWLVPAKQVKRLSELTGLPPDQIRPVEPGA
jgi:hypothetical protein